MKMLLANPFTRTRTFKEESAGTACEYVENEEEEDGIERVSNTCHASEPIWYAISTFLLLPPERYLNSTVARLSIAGEIIYAPELLNLMAMTLLDLLY